MLLAIDVGNSHTVLGLYRQDRLVRTWRLKSDGTRTMDEYAATMHELFRLFEVRFSDIEGAVIASVVPPVLRTLSSLCRHYLRCEPCVIGPQIRTGMPVLYDDPREVGADRIVNAVAAYETRRRSLIVVDFGTATTFDVVTAAGAYAGGAIAPGLGICAEALFERTSKLPRVDFAAPPQAIAKNTRHSMQSGLYFGYAGLVDGMIERMRQELPDTPLVVATGGLAAAIAPASRAIDEVDESLTLEGLRILYTRNRNVS